MKCFVIAEAGVNHNGDLQRALDLVEAAADAGAHAVKFQTFKADMLVTGTAPKAGYQIRQTGAAQSQSEMLKSLELGHAAFQHIADRCRDRSIEFMSTPFDEPSVDFLVFKLGVTQLKVSSGDLTNGPLLLKMAATKRPIILSTGMSTLVEVREALGVLAFGFIDGRQPTRAKFADAFASQRGQEHLREKVTVLHCTSEYPTPFSDVNLRAMDTLRDTFGLAVGYSDHTVGIAVPIAAAARGAAVLEKHFTLDRTLPGPDHAASLEPIELKAMVEAVEQVATSLGSPDKVPTSAEQATAKVARRSLHAIRPIHSGETFDTANVAARRPGTGRSPMEFWDILGTLATREFAAEEMII